MNARPAAVNLAAVRSLLAAGRFREAEEACVALLQHDPADPSARLLRAMACIPQGRIDEARPLVEGLLRDQPGMLPALGLRADILRIDGRFPEAVAAYGEALDREFGLPASRDAWERVEHLLAWLRATPAARWQGRIDVLQAYGFVLEKAKLLPADAAVFGRLAASPIAVEAADFPQRLAATLGVLGFDITADPAWTRAMYEGVLEPWLLRAARGDAFENALQLEAMIYHHYVRQTETEEHFRDCYASWAGPLRDAGRRFAASQPPVAAAAPGPLPRVGFFVHNVSTLAHVQTLLETLEGHASLPRPLIEPVVYFLGGQKTVLERFRAAGVRLEPLVGGTIAPGYAGAMSHLRRRIAEQGVGTLAWISAALGMPFAFGMRVAPRQVWWAMKYHALELPEIDGHVTGGSQTGGTKVIHGREWRVGPVTAAQWFAPELAAEARKVREALGPADVVYGSFGREEKLNSAPFIDAVAQVLRERPQARFLWTGRNRHPDIQRRFDEAGVADRCHFIGWVNTKLYAQVIDVFLDSFPFPCGFTLYEAMAAGKPVVLFDSAESTNGGINALVAPLLRQAREASEETRIAHGIFRPEPGTDLYYRPSDPAEYTRIAVRLGSDAALRERAGNAAREFVERLMADRARAARIFIGHLLGRDAPAGS